MTGNSHNGSGYYDPAVAEMFKREWEQKAIEDKQKGEISKLGRL